MLHLQLKTESSTKCAVFSYRGLTKGCNSPVPGGNAVLSIICERIPSNIM